MTENDRRDKGYVDQWNEAQRINLHHTHDPRDHILLTYEARNQGTRFEEGSTHLEGSSKP